MDPAAICCALGYRTEILHHPPYSQRRGTMPAGSFRSSSTTTGQDKMPQPNKRKVYVPNKGTHDYTKAWDFGELVFCTDGVLNKRDLQTMHSALDKSMLDAQEDDFILLTSLTSLCSVACAVFAARFGKLNLLIFDDGEYLPRHLQLDN